MLSQGVISQVKYCGGFSRGVPPLPIPNREVKPVRADGTDTPVGRVGRCRSSGSPIVERQSDSFFCVVSTPAPRLFNLSLPLSSPLPLPLPLPYPYPILILILTFILTFTLILTLILINSLSHSFIPLALSSDNFSHFYFPPVPPALSGCVFHAFCRPKSPRYYFERRNALFLLLTLSLCSFQ